MFNPGPNDRYVETNMSTILEIFKDYTGDIPEDARAVGISYHKEDKGKLSLVVISDHWTPEEANNPLLVHFDLRRFVPVGG